MSQKEKPVEDIKQPPADRVATTFAATEKSFADLEAKSATMRREIREQSDAYARAQEERQRATAQWDYEEEQRRRAVLDKQREDDRERERRNVEASERIAARDKMLRETVAELFGVPSDPFDPKAAKIALDKKLVDAESKGRAIATKEAERDYATKKQIDDANADKTLALVRSENDRLKSDNAKLEADNKRLSDANMELAKRSGDLALGAFNAAGGLQGKATESLQAAAQGSPRLPNR
jgi:hypothetical protein